jgi:hypothetical protein
MKVTTLLTKKLISNYIVGELNQRVQRLTIIQTGLNHKQNCPDK